MSGNIKKMTSYFRSAITSQVNQKIDFKEEKYSYFSFQELVKGKIEENIYCELQVNKGKGSKEVNVIIVAKTIKTIFDSQEKKNSDLEDLTGVYYLPAILNNDGSLKYNQCKLPWIPREYLEPMSDPVLSMGLYEEYDGFLSDNIGRIHKMKSWKEYINFSIDLYEKVVKESKFENNNFGEIQLEDKVYILKDNRINATAAILRLYDSLIDNYDESKLYENFINLNFKDISPLISNGIDEMCKHSGQMGGEYPLSPSQRECINHFNNMTEGEILAVNGPPGTGKTTLLQSVVANMYVERALKKEKAPLIVATSTNNQAVTNIIESFGKIKVLGHSNLEERWIDKVNSLAVYFPSSSNEKNAKIKGYNYTNSRGENFISDVDNKENIQTSKEKILKKCSEHFKTRFSTIVECEDKLHKTLKEINNVRKDILMIFNEIEGLGIGDMTLKEFLEQLTDEQDKLSKKILNIETRVNEWRVYFKSMPLLYKLFGFLSKVRAKIEIKNTFFIQSQESFINEKMRLHEIEEIYSNFIKEDKLNKGKVDKLCSKLKEQKIKYDEKLASLKKYGIDLYGDNSDENESNIYDVNLKKMNEVLDRTLRYIEFWLSVHYYECRWVKGEDSLTEKQKGKNYKNIIEKLYRRLSMITPCYVMTFYQLPKNFLVYEGSGKSSYIHNFIDLLIVDEAGQVSPEIAACSFSLAKKALVVGDIYQIEPIWSVSNALDKSLAIEHKVIENKDGYENLIDLGLNAANSSVMKVATKSCKYKKYDRGLFLSEHRRCYNEIISYCNELVYKGKLEPMRGNGLNDLECKLKGIPQMGIKQIDTDKSSKRGCSRYNKNEAVEIVNWINRNYESIKEAYPEENAKNLIGVITPFKAQTLCVKREVKKLGKQDVKDNVSIGTVHTFQGAERRIIIISTVYGWKDGCYFLDVNKSMLNVAVSRAKDNFLVFGDINSFKDDEKSSSGLLKKFVSGKSVV